MLAISRRRITAIAVAFGLLAMFPSVLLAQPPVDDKTLATALRAGGFVILVRHGATFADQADTDPLNLDNISAQRNLNDSGKALARAFGGALRQAGVPVGKVYTSKFNRAYETATNCAQSLNRFYFLYIQRPLWYRRQTVPQTRRPVIDRLGIVTVQMCHTR